MVTTANNLVISKKTKLSHNSLFFENLQFKVTIHSGTAQNYKNQPFSFIFIRFQEQFLPSDLPIFSCISDIFSI